MSFIDEMHNLRENIESGKKVRGKRLEEIKKDLSVFMEDATQKRKEDFKVLAGEIKKFVIDSKKDVKTFLKKSQAEQQELKKELSAAFTAYRGKKTKQ